MSIHCLSYIHNFVLCNIFSKDQLQALEEKRIFNSFDAFGYPLESRRCLRWKVSLKRFPNVSWFQFTRKFAIFCIFSDRSLLGWVLMFSKFWLKAPTYFHIEICAYWDNDQRLSYRQMCGTKKLIPTIIFKSSVQSFHDMIRCGDFLLFA